jgi:hypothetical protein
MIQTIPTTIPITITNVRVSINTFDGFTIAVSSIKLAALVPSHFLRLNRDFGDIGSRLRIHSPAEGREELFEVR